jgi:subtilisin family serine protease
MKFRLAIVLLCLLQSTVATAQQSLCTEFPVSYSRILIGADAGSSLADLQQIVQRHPGLLPLDERMEVGQHGWLIAWMDPASPARPQTPAAMDALLQDLERHAEITFARPFIDAGQDLRGVGDRLHVKLQPGTPYSHLEATASRLGMRILGPNPYLRGLYHLQADKLASSDPVHLSIALSADPAFAYVEPDYLLQLDVHTNDPLYFRQWSLENNGTVAHGSGTPGADMQVVDAWNLTMGDSTIKVAIIDSGIDTLHEDLLDNLLPGYDASGGSSNGYPNTTYPNDAHGTSCAGIVAAKANNAKGIAGVCPSCRVLPVKVFYYLFNPFGDPIPFSSGTNMANGISWAWQVGDADVMSNSWGLLDNLLPILPGGTAAAEDAIRLAVDSARAGKGGILLFSSGNDGGQPIWPGRMPGVISVNATTPCDERKYPGSCDLQNWEGNWGDSLDIGAPGVMVSATDLRGSAGWDPSDYTFEFGGTSAACPNAAGVMALVLSANPNLTGTQARHVLESTCEKVGGYAYSTTRVNGTWSQELGYGRVNAFNAVQAAQNFTHIADPQADPSPVVHVAWSASNNALAYSALLPNPDGLHIELINLQGIVLHTWDHRKEKRGRHDLQLALRGNGLSQGTYLVRSSTSDSYSTVRLMVFE